MLKNKKEYLNELYSKLENMLDNENYTSHDIVDLTLDIISQQKRVIKELETRIKEE